MQNIELTPLKNKVTFRKIAMGTWDTPMDPSVYGFIEIDMKKSLQFMSEYEKSHGIRLTPTHLVAKALAYAFTKRPEANAMIRFKKIYLRKKIRLFFQVNIPGCGDDKVKTAELSGTSIDEVDKKTLKQISEELGKKANLIRHGKDKELKKSLKLAKLVPWALMKCYLNFSSFLIYSLNLNLSFLGFPRDPFGSAMVTNVGSFGIHSALVPLCAYTRSPMLLSVGVLEQKAWVENGELCVRPILNIGVTFDHRVIDGVHGGQMLSEFKQCFAEPEKYFAD